MPLPKDQAWFPAKLYGYGWGLPSRWQGWVVVLLFFAALLGGVPFARAYPRGFIGYTVILSALLVVVCAWKGEAPRWRWGENKRR